MENTVCRNDNFHFDKSTFIWQIPSLLEDEKICLCAGYTRMNFKKYITLVIIYLFCEYYSNDSYTLQDIKNAKCAQSFRSSIFSLCSFKWYLELYPKGWYHGNNGSVILVLCLASFPPNLKTIEISLTLSLKELNGISYVRNRDILCKDKNYSMWPQQVLLLNDIQTMKQLTFAVELNITDLFDKQKNSVYNAYFNKYNITNTKPIQLPVVQYHWNITNKNVLNQIKNSPNIFAFASEPFIAYGFLLYLVIYPNGSRVSRKGTVNIFLNWVSNIASSVAMQYDLEWLESGKIFVAEDIAEENAYSSGCIEWPLNTKDLQGMDRMTICVKIKLIDIYKKDEIMPYECITQNIMNELEIPSTSYTWRIREDILQKMKGYEKGVSYKSDIFEMYGMKWYLDLFPKGKSLQRNEGSTVCIHIVSLPTIDTVIAVRYTLSIKEFGINIIMPAVFDNDHLSVSWGAERMDYNQWNWNDVKQCRIELKIELLDAFDGNLNIKHKLISTESMLDNEISILCKINELEQMMNKMNIMSEVKPTELKYDRNEYDESDTLKDWVFNKLKLPQYYHVFIENNIDHLLMMKMITINDLDEMKIVNIGHKLQILIETMNICHDQIVL